MENNSVNPTDNTPDITLHSADSTADITLQSADDRQNSDIFSKIYILELQKKYGIGRDAFYARTRYLRITTWKIGKKAYLDAEQIIQMDGLHDHIQATGKMDGYPVPEASGPVEEQPLQPTVAITVSESAQLTTEQEITKDTRQHDNSETEAIASLVRNAQNKATGVLIAENMLVQQFIQNPEQLPEELRTKIKDSAAMPEVDPFAYANALVNFAKKSGVGAVA
ncbi:MAG: hypothetical protein V7L11_19350 [Nostoc sp.]|uniref:hypothetical protein n=1 Tax=Nostoc sp. TaxID=1180 RepID=UPI002FFAEE0B